MTAKRKPAAKRKPPARKRAAAAVNDTASKTIEFHGIEITVPPTTEWDGDVLFVVADLEQSETPGRMIGVLRMIIGDDQVAQVRARLADEKLNVGQTFDALNELFNLLFQEAGTTAGESPASPSS